jgi:hypothetical protein
MKKMTTLYFTWFDTCAFDFGSRTSAHGYERILPCFQMMSMCSGKHTHTYIHTRPCSADVSDKITAANSASLSRQEVAVREYLSSDTNSAAALAAQESCAFPGWALYGWDPVGGRCAAVWNDQEDFDHGVLDSELAKMSALDTALAAAATMLQVHGLVC